MRIKTMCKNSNCEIRDNPRWVSSAIYAIVLAVAVLLPQAGRCQSTNAEPVSHALALDTVNVEVVIPSWRLIGLFHMEPPASDKAATDPNGFQQDYLAKRGQPEQALTAQNAEALCNSRKICQWYSAHGAAIPLYKLSRGNAPAVAYALAQVTCAHDLDLVLEFDASEEIAVWLNGKLVRMNSMARSGGTAIKYLNVEPIHLVKGDNTLLIKSDRAKDGTQWAVMASLLPTQLAQQKAVDMNYGYFIRNRLLKAGEPLTVDAPPLCQHLESVVTVYDRNDKAIATQKSADFPVAVDTAHFQQGYYRAAMEIAGETIEDEFYIGDPESVYKKLLSVKEKADASSPIAALIDSIIQRYSILTSQQYSHPAEADWQKKLLLVLKDGSEYASDGYNAGIAQSSGFHLREYQSAIDHTTQYYLYYVSRTHAAKMPLVIEMPYVVKNERPFLESALAIGWPKALDDLERAADASGLSVAVINGRGAVQDAPIGEADAFEAINDILSHYSIDRQKIYLFGTSAGGYRAIMLAEHYPNAFAGVGVYGAGLGVPELGRPLGYQDLHTGVFSQVNSLSSVPVHLLEGEFDYEPPRNLLNEFVSELKKVSPSSEMTEVRDGMHGTSDAEKLLFPWLAQFKTTDDHFGNDLRQAVSKAQ